MPLVKQGDYFFIFETEAVNIFNYYLTIPLLYFIP